MPSRRLLISALAIPLLCSAPAQGGQDEGSGECAGACPVEAVSVDDSPYQGDTLRTVMRRGLPFACGQAADDDQIEIDCHIEAKVTIRPKAAKYLGLKSTTIADGVAADRVEHYKNDDDDETDLGRAYFLDIPAAVKAKLSAKRVRALGVRVTGSITVPGTKLYCGFDYDVKKARCPMDSGKKAFVLGAPDGEIVCWTVMPWWVAIKSPGWGKMCPKPINA
jgi:hypothetical protein